MGLMDGSHTFDKLRNRYKGFLVPAVKLKLGGSQMIGQKGIHVGQVQVKLSLKAAGSASFALNSGYDYENRSFLPLIKDKAVLGKTVEVELGYGSDTTLVFKGFVASVSIDFDVENGIVFQITAMDARRLMMTDNCPYTSYNHKNYSDMVKKIMGRYAKLCSLECEATSDNLTEPVWQKVSDYDFITKTIAGEGKADREFFIVADKAYFRKPKGNGTSMLSLGIGTGLKSFGRSADYLNKVIEVQGYDPDSQKPVSGKATAKSKDQQSSVIDPGVQVITESDCRQSDVAAAMAKIYAQALVNENNQASGTCIGLPELVPGRYLKLEGVDSLINREYYVTEISHSISEGGFTTGFSTEGWK